MEKNKEFLKTSRLQKTYEGLFASSDKPTQDCLTPALTFDEKCKADEVVQDIGCWKRFKKYCTRKIFNLETYFKQSYMSNANNIPATTQTKVVEKKIKEKVQVHDLGLRPLPEVDYNELQYIVEPVYPVYPGQNVLVKEPVNLGYTNQRIVEPGPSMVRNQPYIQKQIKIKEKIKEPNVM